MSTDRRGKDSSRSGRGRPAARPSATRAALRRGGRRGPAFERPRLVLGRTNYLLLGAAALAIVLGFVLLQAGDISISAVLLVVGYCVLIPAALLIERLPGRRRGGEAAGPAAGGEGTGGE